MLLISWAKRIGFTGRLAKAEPRTFRNEVLHIAGRTATRSRTLWLHLDRNWPGVKQIAAAYQHIRHAFKHRPTAVT